MTTPEEYEAQTYEGASTLYGPVTGPLVMEHLNNVAKKGLQPAPPQGAPTRPALTSEHLPGGNASFTLADAGEPRRGQMPGSGILSRTYAPESRRATTRPPAGASTWCAT